MTYEANIKIAPIFTCERFNTPAWTRPGRWLYERLDFLPGRETAQLLVDHDPDREVGVVNHLWRWDWTDGPWVVANVTVTDPPCWLKRGTRASFAFGVVQRRHLDIAGTQAEVIARGLVREVSLLSPGTDPAEPRAEVLGLRQVARAESVPTPARSEPAGEVFYGGGSVIRRPAGGHIIGVR